MTVDRDGVPIALLTRDDEVSAGNASGPTPREPPASFGELLHSLAAAHPRVRLIGVGRTLVLLMAGLGNVPTVGAQAAVDGGHHVADHIWLHADAALQSSGRM